MSAHGHSARPVDPRHDLLVRAVLSPGDAGRRAYEQWRHGVEIFTLDQPSTTLLAGLSQRLGKSADDVIAAQINKVARMTWLRGQLLVSLTAPALQDLASFGIPMTLAKGAAVLHHCGMDLRARPMDDVDVLVPFDRVRHATHRLVAGGFDCELAPLLGAHPESVQRTLHGAIFRNARGAAVDLHWHLLANRLHPAADDLARESAVDAMWGSVPVQVTSREDTLVHVVVHAAGFMQNPALRWATDAAALIRTGPVDWDVVSDRAARLRLGPVVADGLAYLVDVAPDLAIPADAVARLAGQRPSPVERFLAVAESATSRSPGTPFGWRRSVALAAADWRRDLDQSIEPGTAPTPRDLARVVTDERRSLRATYSPRAVPLGRRVSCRLRGNGKAATQLVAGWHYSEPHGTWSARRRARVVVALDEPQEGPLVLVVDVVPFLSPSRPRMDVRVRVDGRVSGTWTFRGGELHLVRRRVRVPARPGRTRIDVVLDVRDPLTGYDNATFGDERALGIALHRFFVRGPLPDASVARTASSVPTAQ